MTKYKIGDKVRCIPGYTDDNSSIKYGGHAYFDGFNKTFLTIDGISLTKYKSKDGTLHHWYYFKEIKYGIYEYALMLYSEHIVNDRDDKLNKLLK